MKFKYKKNDNKNFKMKKFKIEKFQKLKKNQN
jgi:hypothetical protein